MNSIYYENYLNGHNLDVCLPGMRLNEIAWVITQDWKSMNYAARPYVMAMYHLQYIQDFYHLDSASSIVKYLLSNSGTWRGEKARLVKKELKKRIQ